MKLSLNTRKIKNMYLNPLKIKSVASKIIIVKLLCILLLITGCTKKYVGSDLIITKTIDLAEFTKIEANDSMDVNVSHGNLQVVEITINDNLQDKIITTVSNGTLKISLKNGSYKNEDISVNILIPNLEKLQFNDAISGTVNFETNELELVINDASSLKLIGSADVLNLKLNDASDIKGYGFTTEILNMEVKDASNLEITCTTELNGMVSDASDVRYRGTPTINAKTEDGGRILNSN